MDVKGQRVRGPLHGTSYDTATLPLSTSASGEAKTAAVLAHVVSHHAPPKKDHPSTSPSPPRQEGGLYGEVPGAGPARVAGTLAVPAAPRGEGVGQVRRRTSGRVEVGQTTRTPPIECPGILQWAFSGMKVPAHPFSGGTVHVRYCTSSRTPVLQTGRGTVRYRTGPRARCSSSFQLSSRFLVSAPQPSPGQRQSGHPQVALGCACACRYSRTQVRCCSCLAWCNGAIFSASHTPHTGIPSARAQVRGTRHAGPTTRPVSMDPVCLAEAWTPPRRIGTAPNPQFFVSSYQRHLAATCSP